MSLFKLNPYRVSEELTPQQLRTSINTAWLRVLLRPMKYMADLFTKSYCDGTTYADYDNSTTYAKYDRVVWKDLAVYECRVASSVGVYPTGAALSGTNWRKVLENHVGVDERMKWTGQLIVFEQAINRHFRNTGPPWIYCEAITPGAATTTVTIWVPAAFYATLGPNDASRDARILEFATRYMLGGWGVDVETF